MMRYAAGLLLCLGACGGIFRSDGEPDPDALRLCIRNETAAYGTIVAHAGLVRFNVMPGQEACRVLAGQGSLTLRANTIGGGASGPLRYAATLQSGSRGCWRWRLTNSPASAADLSPCAEGSDAMPGDTPRGDAAAGS